MKHIILGALLLACSTRVFSQQPRLLTLQEVIDSIPKLMEEQHIAGLTLGVATKDSILFTGGFGFADIEGGRKTDQQTLFRFGSITKMFVSLGILQLISEGKIDLNSELKLIAPEIPFQNPWEASHPVQIVHLLEHTTGFDDMKLNRQYAPGEIEFHEENVAMVHKNSFVSRWKPGERFAYSNPNYTVLGYIIEKFSGKPYDEYLKSLILEPLGMDNSNFNLRSKFPEVDVKEYVFRNDGYERVPSVTMIGGPQGALWSCSADMVRFLQMFLRDGAPVFPDQFLDEMELSHSSLGARAGLINSYALGNTVGMPWAKFPFRGHSGLTGTCFSEFLYDRKLGVGLVIASNSNVPPHRITDLVISYLTQNKPEPEPIAVPLDEEAIKPYLGYYQFDSPRNEIATLSVRFPNLHRVYLENGNLYASLLFSNTSRLVQTGPLTFTWEGGQVPAFVFTENEAGDKVMCILGSYYTKTSAIKAFSLRGILIIAILFAALSVLIAITSLVGMARRKQSPETAVNRSLPAIGFGFLIWALMNLVEVQQYTYLLSELGAINYRTMAIFIGTFVFAICSAGSLIYAIVEFQSGKRNGFMWYYMITAVSVCLITSVLLVHGLIGLRTWAM